MASSPGCPVQPAASSIRYVVGTRWITVAPLAAITSASACPSTAVARSTITQVPPTLKMPHSSDAEVSNVRGATAGLTSCGPSRSSVASPGT